MHYSLNLVLVIMRKINTEWLQKLVKYVSADMTRRDFAGKSAQFTKRLYDDPLCTSLNKLMYNVKLKLNIQN